MSRIMLQDFLFKIVLLFDPLVLELIQEVTDRSLARADGKRKEKIFVMLVGHSLAGKTSYAEGQHSLRSSFVISSRTIYDAFDESLDNFRAMIRSRVVRILLKHARNVLFEEAFRAGYAVVSDACNLTFKDRKEYLELARYHEYETVILEVECPENILALRATEADREHRGGKGTSWHRILRRQRRAYCRPHADEQAMIVTVRADHYAFPTLPSLDALIEAAREKYKPPYRLPRFIRVQR